MQDRHEQGSLLAGKLHALEARQRGLCLLGVEAPLVDTEGAAVHRFGDSDEILGVARAVDLMALPVLTGDAKGKYRVGGKFRMCFERSLQHFAEPTVVGAARQLQQSATLVAGAVPWLRVAEVRAA